MSGASTTAGGVSSRSEPIFDTTHSPKLPRQPRKPTVVLSPQTESPCASREHSVSPSTTVSRHHKRHHHNHSTSSILTTSSVSLTEFSALQLPDFEGKGPAGGGNEKLVAVGGLSSLRGDVSFNSSSPGIPPSGGSAFIPLCETTSFQTCPPSLMPSTSAPTPADPRTPTISRPHTGRSRSRENSQHGQATLPLSALGHHHRSPILGPTAPSVSPVTASTSHPNHGTSGAYLRSRLPQRGASGSVSPHTSSPPSGLSPQSAPSVRLRQEAPPCPPKSAERSCVRKPR